MLAGALLAVLPLVASAEVKLEEKDGTTTAVVSYRVSGDAAHKLDQLAPIVDQVLGMQFGAFVALAGQP